MGLTAGTHTLNATVRHNPPLIFDVEQDPSESYPLDVVDIDPLVLLRIEQQKQNLTFQPQAIDPRFVMKWALCCSVATNCTCATPQVIRENRVHD